ncbi:MAG TPA: hypothetical protein VGN97_08950 [Mesorhizobium sp.]|jgi:hypothetical protein|nr:hypothetical protein [Mesorhizobium sp.]
MPAPPSDQTLVFSAPFRLASLGETLPAGSYRVEHQWEPVEGLTQTGYRRAGSFLHLPSIGTASLVRQAVPVDFAELTAALENDRRNEA